MYLHAQEQTYNLRVHAWLYSAADSRHTCWSSSNQRHALGAAPRSAHARAWRRNAAAYWDHCCCTLQRPLWSRVLATAQGIPRGRLKQPRVLLASRKSPRQSRLRQVPEALSCIANDRAVRRSGALVSYQKRQKLI